ncbi:MAG: 2-polyprenyl-3-methyl-6-methoxy-1,4-benzoquinone monooxygenase [Nevskia sp.]|nr:2-polyprenyl-3-methyl-6-methoxy-1,4-benzoquinone monooxygenase [Nevskia sp.]
MPGSKADSRRDYSPADRLLMRLHDGLRTMAPQGAAEGGGADYPAARLPDAPLDAHARRHAAGLMRINHAGEVSAQALYQGQALVSRDADVRAHLLKAAGEERAHLRWCEERLHELGERPSLLSPLWYVGSFAIGAAAGIAGDRWNLGFVEETERQVVEHLEDHLEQLPSEDGRSRAIVEAMKQDEERHGDEAAAAGARALPPPVRALMRRVARMMKFGAYRL